jgi:hypothetical protein
MNDASPPKAKGNSDHSLLYESAGIAAGVAALTKSLEIAKSTNAAHGTYWRIDSNILNHALTNNIKCHVKYGAIAGVVYYLGNRLFPQNRSFVDRVEAERSGPCGDRSL